MRQARSVEEEKGGRYELSSMVQERPPRSYAEEHGEWVVEGRGREKGESVETHGSADSVSLLPHPGVALNDDAGEWEEQERKIPFGCEERNTVKRGKGKTHPAKSIPGIVDFFIILRALTAAKRRDKVSFSEEGDKRESSLTITSPERDGLRTKGGEKGITRVG